MRKFVKREYVANGGMQDEKLRATADSASWYVATYRDTRTNRQKWLDYVAGLTEEETGNLRIDLTPYLHQDSKLRERAQTDAEAADILYAMECIAGRAAIQAVQGLEIAS